MTVTEPGPRTTRDRPRPSLTRERVIGAAVRIMDAEGLDAVTMRRVAREVGVEAMSLYHHVRDKDDLLDEICVQVMREFRIPEGPSRGWPESGRDAAREWRRLLKAHPNVISVFAERRKPMTNVDALRPMEYALSLQLETGMDLRDAVEVFNVVGGYIMGFVMMEMGMMFSAGTLDPEAPDPAGSAEALPESEVPVIRAALPHLATCDPDEQFELGLDLMFAGIRARFATERSEPA
jgi:TetR/AcrR family tetracycline transcriptional repressor